jgi:nitroreductase
MFFSMIKARRSIRKFLNKPVESDKIDIIMETALRSPSSRGFNPWEFVVVQDREMLSQLSQCKPHGASFLKDAPLGIVVLADPKVCDVWVEDTSIAATYIQLIAESMALKSCWIQVRKREYDKEKSASQRVAELLGIPPHLEVACIIAIGYPAENLPSHTRESLN